MAEPIVKATMAADIFATNLDRLAHPTAGMIRLVQFAHDSPGLRTLRKHIGESLVILLEGQGWYLCNGLDDAVKVLTDAGYTVTKGE